jgi:hypothetical protein
MKAQISFVEFLTTLIIFISFVTYLSFQISTLIPNYLSEVRRERINSEAFQLSELLINDPGEPTNWPSVNFNDVKRLGLSDEKTNKTNFLSLYKIKAFDSNCSSNYAKVKEKLGADYDFSVFLIDDKSQLRINCKPTTIIFRGINITMRRVVVFDGGFGELILQVW